MSNRSIPFLRRRGATWELIVDDKPWIIRGAELHNSSMSSASYMETAWQNLVDMNINTVLGAVHWKDIERVEGQFDFTELDAILKSAASYELRLVLLWFGSFKNGASSYTPPWVSKDPKRFPRMIRRKEGKLSASFTISIVDGEGAMADARAFKALMTHLREVDHQRTVVMVQVENEVGLLGDSRDRSLAAEKLFKSPVPKDLIDFLSSEWEGLHPKLKALFSNLPDVLKSLKDDNNQDLSWTAVFGESSRTDELFMAYHYSRFVEQVAAAGRQAYEIPLFANTWIPMPGEIGAGGVVSGGGQPGEYPSGGPAPGVLDIWMKYAPSLDFLAPDIYAGKFSDVCAAYSHKGNALFIPEMQRNEYGARCMWEAIGSYNALGVSPFGIDSLLACDSPFTKQYKLLASVSSIVSKARLRPETMIGFYMNDFESVDADKPIIKRFGNWELTVGRAFVFGKPGPAFGIIIDQGSDRFLCIGAGFKVNFASTSPSSVFCGVLHVEEKRVSDPEKGTLVTERNLCGDETSSDSIVNMPNDDPDYGGVPIPVLVPARTMIAEATVYSLEASQIPEIS